MINMLMFRVFEQFLQLPNKLVHVFAPHDKHTNHIIDMLHVPRDLTMFDAFLVILLHLQGHFFF